MFKILHSDSIMLVVLFLSNVSNYFVYFISSLLEPVRNFFLPKLVITVVIKLFSPTVFFWLP